MAWGFIWLMFVLKIPIVMLLTIVWWAVKQTPEPAGDGDGGSRLPAAPEPHQHPRRPLPRHPRRGPHGPGDHALPSPPRTRAVVARARSLDR
jgi:hypothetical protein